MTSMTSGSPSAISSALAKRLSKRWRWTPADKESYAGARGATLRPAERR